jgi:hypothetical protein
MKGFHLISMRINLSDSTPIQKKEDLLSILIQEKKASYL